MANRVHVVLEDIEGTVEWIGASYRLKSRKGEDIVARDIRVIVPTTRATGNTIQYYHLKQYGQKWVNEVGDISEGDKVQFDLEIIGRPSKDGYEDRLDSKGNVRTFTDLLPVLRKPEGATETHYLTILEKKTIDKLDDSKDGMDIMPENDLPF